MVRSFSNDSVIAVELGHERNLLELLDSPESRTNFIHIRHPNNGNASENLTQISRRSDTSRRILVELTRRGFYTYMSHDYETRLVRERRIPSLWAPLANGEFKQSKAGVIYSLNGALVDSESPKLLVLFCPMHEAIYSSSLYRYFPQQFKTIQKYIAPETAVLRVADLGGVVGNFYGNTSAHPKNIDRIQELLQEVIFDLRVQRHNVVLYGGSKGGTGALLHGLIGGYKVIAVDPVLSDRHYVNRHNDSHFTENSIFLESKDRLFARLVFEYQKTADWDAPVQRKVVVYSSGSPQARVIEEKVVEPLAGGVASFDVEHPMIKDHPDVGPNSLPLTLAIINSLLYGLDVPAGNRRVV